VKVARIEVKPYRLALATPIRVAGVELHSREGALVRAVSEAGATGWGDCAPLPGLSRESLWGALREIEAVQGFITTREIASFSDLADCARAMHAISPSARFALEAAIACAAAEEAGETVGQWLLGTSADRCDVNALATGAPETWAEAAQRAVSEKFRVLKIKVGRDSMERELGALVEAASGAPGLHFRLDANRAWSEVSACAFAREVQSLPVEYIEEPFAGAFVMPREWPEKPGLAMDESLWGMEDPPEPRPPVVAWVLKPTLVGGLVRAIGLAMRARRAGCAAVWSAAYESGVGIRMLAELGGAMGGVAGLDTLRALDEDVLTPRIEIASGAIDLRAARASAVAI
jgi:O-succinylbenzoate synthase